MRPPGSEGQANSKLTLYSLFAWLWAMSVIWHYLRPGHGYHVAWVDLAPVLCAILVLIRPRNWRFLLLTAATLCFVYLIGLPSSGASNHWTTHFFVSLSLCASFALLALKRRPFTIDAREWLRLFRPVVCLLVMALYLFASLHKLNSRYMSEHGAAPKMYLEIVGGEGMSAFAPLLPTDAGFLALLPALSVLTELAIPVLLLFRRTRLAAMLLGMIFHTALSLRAYPYVTDFPLLLGAAFVLFLPEAAIALINASLLDRWRRSAFYEPVKRLIIPALLLALIFVPALFALPARDTVTWFTFANLMAAHWALYAAAYVAILVFLIVKLRGGDYVSSPLIWRRAHIPLMPIIALTVFVGLSPYLGLKTAGAFTMFSQLETEGGHTNHFFMPLELQLFDYQKQVCVIETTAADIPVTAATGELLTWFQFRKLTRTNPEAAITYEFKGERHELQRIADKPELTGSADLFERFYLTFQHTNWANKTSHCD